MAEIDPFVEPLLTGLLNSPLAPLGRVASVRLDEDEGLGDVRFEIARGPRAARRRRRSRAERQVKVIDAVVQNALTRELDLTDRLHGLAERVGVKTIGILPPEQDEGAVRAGPVDQLLSPVRAAAIKAFLAAWTAAVGETRQRLERDL